MRKKRVLLIDDEVDFTRLMKLNLDQLGKYEVRVESRGENAYAAAKEFLPHVILLDVILPDVGSNEIAARLEQDKELGKIPIVFVTAILSKEQVPELGEFIEGHRFLAKPVKLSDVLDCIEHPRAA